LSNSQKRVNAANIRKNYIQSCAKQGCWRNFPHQPPQRLGKKQVAKSIFFNTKTHKTMRLRNKILAMAVVAVAGFNTYLANDIRVQRNELSLLNLENIAEANEDVPIEGGGYTGNTETHQYTERNAKGYYNGQLVYMEVTYIDVSCDGKNQCPCEPCTYVYYVIH